MYRDASLIADRMAELQHEARESALGREAILARPHRPSRTRRTLAALLRATATAALVVAAWIDARASDGDAASPAREIAYHRS